MTATTRLYTQVFDHLRQHSNFRDLGHLKALAWMVTALVCSGQLTLSAWEVYVPSQATQSQSFERRWQRFLQNRKIRVKALYVPRWLQGVVSKGRQLLEPIPLLSKDPQPCFASKGAEERYYNQFRFSRIRTWVCKPCPCAT